MKPPEPTRLAMLPPMLVNTELAKVLLRTVKSEIPPLMAMIASEKESFAKLLSSKIGWMRL